jgi:hypothetical protein
MMIEVFVHQNGPLLRFEWTKERMWVLGAARCAFVGEAVDRCDQRAAFSAQSRTYFGPQKRAPAMKVNCGAWACHSRRPAA